MEKIMIMIPLLIIVSVLGIARGMYISSQVKCHIRKSINNKELMENLNEKKKTK
jgi:hypothetical protein